MVFEEKQVKICGYGEKAVSLHRFSKKEGFRDVAQLVAHYVRDVGVGRSSRLIPTKGDKRVISVVAF